MRIQNTHPFIKYSCPPLSIRKPLSFKGTTSDSLSNVCANPAIKKRLDSYLEWYFDNYPNQLNLFMKDLNKLSGYSDELSFNSLRRRFKSFGDLPGVLQKLNSAESMRSGYVIESIKDQFKKVSHKPKTIIDIGCGNGTILRGLKDSYSLPYTSLAGVDVYEDTARHPFSRLKYDGSNLQRVVEEHHSKARITPEKYDTAIITSVLHHSDDHIILLNQANKVLKPNGVLLIEDISPDEGYGDFHTVLDNVLSIFQDTSENNIPGNYINFNKLKELAAETGFEVKNIDIYMPDVLKQFTAVLQKTC